MLNGESELASLYSKKEFLSARQKKASRKRASVERLRSKSAFDLRSYRDALEKRREQNRTKELSLERFAQEIKTLEERMKEDYNLDLFEVEFKIEGVDARRQRPPTILGARYCQGNAARKSATKQSTTRASIVPAPPRAQSEKEIEELRVKLNDFGSVNRSARTLETLKTRYTTLFNRYNDLVAARKSIQKIVERVSADCRKMFDGR